MAVGQTVRPRKSVLLRGFASGFCDISQLKRRPAEARPRYQGTISDNPLGPACELAIMLSPAGRVVSRSLLEWAVLGSIPGNLRSTVFASFVRGGSITSVCQEHQEGSVGDILALSFGFRRNDSKRTQGGNRF